MAVTWEEECEARRARLAAQKLDRRREMQPCVVGWCWRWALASSNPADPHDGRVIVERLQVSNAIPLSRGVVAPRCAPRMLWTKSGAVYRMFCRDMDRLENFPPAAAPSGGYMRVRSIDHPTPGDPPVP